MTATAPWITTAYALESQPASLHSTMGTNCLRCKHRTTRFVAAAPVWTKQHSEHRRNRPSVQANHQSQAVLRDVHVSFNNPPRRSACRKSFSTSLKLLPTIEFRATKTRSTGSRNSCWCRRKVSRKSLRARLRITAPPIFFPVMTPIRLGVSPCSGNQLAIRHPTASRWPLLRTRAKSRLN